uniref:Protease inhibitor n=1 Tax=Schistocerca gregaria TaxID=7010 RepID=A0A8E5NIB9_SCHGR|nr:Pacifastin-related peptide precursor [Schistocerca gregaria]
MVSRTAALAVLVVALVLLACCNADPAAPETKVRVRRAEKRCTPNTTFKKDCNTCSCNKDGTAAVCTLKGCLSRSTRAVACTPGTTYKEQCNVCRCGPDGKSGACTRKACPPGSY